MWLPFKHFTKILTLGLFEQVTGPVYIFYQFSQYFSLLFCSLFQILKVGLLGQIRSLPMGVAQYTDFTSFLNNLLYFFVVCFKY